jgi:hypothetical protein
VDKISHKPLKTKHLINRSTFALVRSVLRLPSGLISAPKARQHPAKRRRGGGGTEL